MENGNCMSPFAKHALIKIIKLKLCHKFTITQKKNLTNKENKNSGWQQKIFGKKCLLFTFKNYSAPDPSER